jgi:hypothetical protein
MQINYQDLRLDLGINQLKNSGYIKEDGKLSVSAVRKDIEGYQIIKNNNNITILYDRTSCFYKALSIALSTSKKILKVESDPISKNLGVMIDCSRNAVVTVDYLKTFIEEIALLGYTYIGLYTEDTIEVIDEPYFGYQRGRLSKEEIKEIVEFSSLFNIEVIPFIQTLAHLNAIFKWPTYWGIRDTSDILLLEDERTYQLLENLFKSIRQVYSTKRINIGMDEAYLLGYGRYRELHGVKDRYDIMKKHLDFILSLCKKYDFQPEMWCDMFFRIAFNGEYRIEKKSLPEEVKNIVPKEVKLIYWEYLHDDEQRYFDNLSMNLELSDQVGFACGAWKWQGFAPNNRLSERAGRPAFGACRKQKVNDILVTAWGDNGAECSLKSIAASLVLFSMLNDFDQEDETIVDDLSRFIYGYRYEQLRSLDLPDILYDEAAIMANPSRYIFYNDLLTGMYDYHIYSDFIPRYEEMSKLLLKNSKINGKLKIQFTTLYYLSLINGLKSEIILNFKKAYDQKDRTVLCEIKEKISKLNILIKKFYQSFKSQWNKENKPFGFEVQDIRIGGMILRNQNIISRINDYLDGRVDKIIELEAERLPFNGVLNPLKIEDKFLFANLWHDLVSPANY